jgi:hypothetical protein
VRDRAHPVGPDDDRTAEQRRFDAFKDLLLGRDPLPLHDPHDPTEQCSCAAGPAGGGRAACGCLPGAPVPCGAELLVHLTQDSGLGTSDQPAELVGHGPLEPDLLQALLLAAPRLRPVWTDEHGVVVAVGDQVVIPERDDPASVRAALLQLAALPPPALLHPRHPHDHQPDPADHLAEGAARESDAAPDSDMAPDHASGQPSGVPPEVDWTPDAATAPAAAGRAEQLARVRLDRPLPQRPWPPMPRASVGRRSTRPPPARTLPAPTFPAPPARTGSPGGSAVSSRRAPRAASGPAAAPAPPAATPSTTRLAAGPDLRLQPRTLLPPAPPRQAARLDQDPHRRRCQLDQPRPRPLLAQPQPARTTQPSRPPPTAAARRRPARPAQPDQAEEELWWLADCPDDPPPRAQSRRPSDDARPEDRDQLGDLLRTGDTRWTLDLDDPYAWLVVPSPGT